jgi:hypothetical protein
LKIIKKHSCFAIIHQVLDYQPMIIIYNNNNYYYFISLSGRLSTHDNNINNNDYMTLDEVLDKN